MALKGLTPSGQLPVGVLSEGKAGLSTGELLHIPTQPSHNNTHVHVGVLFYHSLVPKPLPHDGLVRIILCVGLS